MFIGGFALPSCHVVADASSVPWFNPAACECQYFPLTRRQHEVVWCSLPQTNLRRSSFLHLEDHPDPSRHMGTKVGEEVRTTLLELGFPGRGASTSGLSEQNTKDMTDSIARSGHE
jgi:hypothetical protein